MPNYVTNNLTIFGTPVQVKAFRDAVRDPKAPNDDDARIFDFNHVVPMPKELRDTVYPMRIISDKEYAEQEARLAKGILSDMERMMGSPSRSLTQALSNEYCKKFGANNWYDWSCQNWGTKWNAGSCHDNDDPEGNFISFQTAWAHPQALFSSMSERFPDLAFVCTYADEDMGSNCGLSAYRNGVFQHMSAESVGADFALAFAFVVLYGDDTESILAEWIADDTITKAKANAVRKAIKSDHPLMKIARDLSTISLDTNMPLLEG